MQFVSFQLCDFATGAAIPNGKCFVYLTGTSTLAALYDSGGSGIANPAIASSVAQVGFAAADGLYDFQPAYPDGSAAGPKILDQQMFDMALSLATRAAIAAIAGPTDGMSRYLTEAGREGRFVFRTTDFAARYGTSIAVVDPNQGIYIAPAAAPTGASGAWVRMGWAALDIRYFGAKVDNSTNDGVAVSAAWAFSYATRRVSTIAGIDYGSGAGAPVYIPGATYVGTTGLTANHSFKLLGDSAGLPAAPASFLRWDAGVTGLTVNNSGFYPDGVFLLSAFSGTEGEHHAIKASRVFQYRNIGGGNWPGDFMNLDCSGGANVNGVVGENVWVFNCRNAYWNKAGSDNSAGAHRNWNIDSCRELGIKEETFLQISHSSHEIAQCSLTVYNDGVNIGCSVTSYSGNRYFAIAGQETWCSTHAPSGNTTDNQGWAYNGAGGALPAIGIIAWFNGILVRAGGSVIANNANADSKFDTIYVEGGMGKPQISGLAVAIGGQLAQNMWKGNATTRSSPAIRGSDQGFRAGVPLLADGGYLGTDETLEVQLGESGNLKTIVAVNASVSFPLTFRYEIDAGDIVARYAGSQEIYRLTGPTTTRTFGRSAAVLYAFNPQNLFLAPVGRSISSDFAAPTTGNHAQGEIVFNAGAAAAGKVGWVCTTGGTPGTWKAFGVIDA